MPEDLHHLFLQVREREKGLPAVRALGLKGSVSALTLSEMPHFFIPFAATHDAIEEEADAVPVPAFDRHVRRLRSGKGSGGVCWWMSGWGHEEVCETTREAGDGDRHHRQQIRRREGKAGRGDSERGRAAVGRLHRERGWLRWNGRRGAG